MYAFLACTCVCAGGKVSIQVRALLIGSNSLPILFQILLFQISFRIAAKGLDVGLPVPQSGVHYL